MTSIPTVPDKLSKASRPQSGLDDNPAKTKAVFSQNHPYMPQSCSKCPFYKPTIKDRLKGLFTDRKKDCYNCKFINGCIGRSEAKDHIDKAAKALRKEIIAKDLMPIQGDKEVVSLKTGKLHTSGKVRMRFLRHAHHDYDVEATQYVWNNPHSLKEPRVYELGEGKDLSDPIVQRNLVNKKKRHVHDYIEYKLDYNEMHFLVKLERMDFGVEQFYSIKEE